MLAHDVAFTPAWQLRELIAKRQISPVELTELYLRRIEALNPKLNAYLTVTADEAMAAARAAEQAVLRGEARSPLHGIPISIKDLEVTKGIRTTMGSSVFKDHVPEQDTIVVERVRQAGAIILGKTNTPEFGLSGTTENRLGDACRNPWDSDCTAGGSSGGAGAALVAGLCALATGSDGGGSIRIPSSFCGVYGIKPTLGRVPRYGGVGKPSFNVTSQSGPMARTVRDAALLLQVLAGPDRRDVGCIRQSPPDFLAALDQDAKGLRLAWSSDLGYAAVDPEVIQICQQAARVFKDLGGTLDEAKLMVQAPFPAFRDLFCAGAYTSYGHLLEQEAASLTSYARDMIAYGRGITGADYSRALLFVQQLKAQMEDFFEQYDLLLTPTMAVPAFPVDQRPAVIAGRQVDPMWGYLPFTFPFNLTGQPAASVPCGFSSKGLPIGLHMIGRVGEETTVLRASAAFEGAYPWGDKRPRLA